MLQNTLMARLILPFALLTVTVTSAAQTNPVDYTDHALVKVEILTRVDIDLLNTISPDIWSEHVYAGLPVLARIPPDSMDDLINSGLDFDVLVEDLGPGLASYYPANRVSPRETTPSVYEEYKTYDEMLNLLNTFVASCPADMTCEVFSVGTSFEGEDIWAIKLEGPEPDELPGIMIQGLQHAREWIAGSAVLCFLDHIINNYETDPDLKAIVDKVNIFAVPCINPDGYRYSWDTDRLWRYNRRDHGTDFFGVDLNRNWDVRWGYYGDGTPIDPEVYPDHGSEPLSEPEISAMANFAVDHSEISAYLDVHSAGELILMPWGFTYETISQTDLDVYEPLGTEMVDIVEGVHGNVYQFMQGVELYPAFGTAHDHYYGDTGEMAFTIELPPAQDEFDDYGWDDDYENYLSHWELAPERILPTAQETTPMFLHVAKWASQNPDFEITLEDGGIPPVDPSTDSDSDSDTDTDTDTDTDADTDTDSDTNSDTDTETDTDDTDTEQDDLEGETTSCGCTTTGIKPPLDLTRTLVSLFY